MLTNLILVTALFYKEDLFEYLKEVLYICHLLYVIYSPSCCINYYLDFEYSLALRELRFLTLF